MGLCRFCKFVTTLWQVTGQRDRGQRQTAWEDLTIDAARGVTRDRSAGGGSSLELGVLLKDRWCEEIEYFLKTSFMKIVLVEFKQNCAESGLGRMYRKVRQVWPVATLLSEPGRIGHSWN
jgi:hypothetical protein